MKVLIIDNYDSFTYNLYQLAGVILGDTNKPFVLDVRRNDEVTAREIKDAGYDRIIISPGPGRPDDAAYFGVCREVILDIGQTTPVLGVCLGMQGIAHCFGGKVVRAKRPMHGKVSRIGHSGRGLFAGVPQGVNVMRYHSLAVEKKSLPKTLEVTAETRGGGQKEIMGLRHKAFPVAGVQFHPESYATEYGRQVLTNFLLGDAPVPATPLSFDQAYSLQAAILNNERTTEDILSIFAALEKRELHPDELLGFYEASRKFMRHLPGGGSGLLDTCGTGGDNLHTFNISTAAALVCASLGVKVAKHGNRASTSTCGSADILEALGVNISLEPEQARLCLERCGITFMFAPVYHPAFKHARDARRQFGKKTYFNILGPLLNPADAGFRLVGVADEARTGMIVRLLRESGVKHALLVHGADGLDEVSPFTVTKVHELKHGRVRSYEIDPKNFGFTGLDPADMRVETVDDAKKVFIDILSGVGTPAQRAAVILNSAAALVAASAAKDFRQGIRQAGTALQNGTALAKLEELKKVSNELS